MVTNQVVVKANDCALRMVDGYDRGPYPNPRGRPPVL